jgi:hypothetical protein
MTSHFQPSPLILDLDQAMHRSALLESIQYLESLVSILSSSQTSELRLTHQALLRLTYLAIHCRTSSDTQSAIQSLHRESQHHLAQTLEHQVVPHSLLTR